MAATFSSDRRLWAPLLGLVFAFSMAVMVFAQKGPGALDDPNQGSCPRQPFRLELQPAEPDQPNNVKNLSVA
jgi:hypothetical protein